MKLQLVTISLAAFLAIACSSKEEKKTVSSQKETKELKIEVKHDHGHNHDHDEGTEHKKMEMSPEMKAHANEAYGAYLNISAGLSADDFTMAKQAVTNLVALSEKASTEHKKSEEHKNMSVLISSLKEAKDIKTLRESFKVFSNKFINHMSAHKDMLSKSFKVFYCPMAKGRWAQDKGGLKNPYYGAEMLTCGGEEK